MTRRLVSIVVSTFADPYSDQPLEFAPELGRRLVSVLAGHEYVADPEGGYLDLDHTQMALAVRQAISSARPGDLLIVHVLSHAVERNEAVLVVGADGKADSGTSLDSWIMDATGNDEYEDSQRSAGDRQPPGPLVLFLVDVCGAGQAVRQAFQLRLDDEVRRAWVMAGTLPRHAGYDGHFTEALASVLSDLSQLDPHFSFQYVPLPLIARAVRRKVQQLAAEHGCFPQRVVSTRIDLAADVVLPFFDNPTHRASLLSSVPPELYDVVAAVDALVDPWHFVSRASGRLQHGERLQMGCFHGRSAELSRITQWMSNDQAGALLVVTGSPGVGKSALIGMVVCAAHPRLAVATQKLWWGRRGELPLAPVQRFVAVHARERSLPEILQSLARQLQLPDPNRQWSVEVFAAGLRDVEPRPVIALDALDEAINPTAVMAAALALADTRGNAGMPACRLIVGTRSGIHWPLFQPLCDRAESFDGLVDLDHVASRDALRNDVQQYVDDLMRADDVYGRQELLAVRQVIAASIAESLTRHRGDDEQPRWGEFLVAAVFVRHFTQLPVIHDEAQAARRARAVPTTLPEVFELDLSRQTSSWLVPVLTSVAHAFGAGMPREVIRECCATFAPAELGDTTDEAVVEALHEARFYLRRDHEADGTTLYRLFHQALADHLRARTSSTAAATHARILDRMLRMVSYQPGTGGDWEDGLTTPYLLRHAIDHAAACDRVDVLLEDLQFLVHADPVSLTRQIRRARSEPARRAAAVYQSSSYRHMRANAAARRDLLVLDAVRRGERRLANQLAGPLRPFPSLSWVPTWSSGAQVSASLIHILDGHPGGVAEVTVALLDSGVPVAVTVDEEGAARVWDLTDGALRRVLSGPGVTTRTLCTRLGDGSTLCATAGEDGDLRLWNLPEGSLHSRITLDGAPYVTAMAELPPEAPRNGIVCADKRGRLYVCDVDVGHSSWIQAHDAEITAVACTRLTDGTDIAITAGVDGTVLVWNVHPGTLRNACSGHTGWVGAITCHRLIDERAIAVTTGADGCARVWDLATGALQHTLAEQSGWTGPAACARVSSTTGLPLDVVVVPGSDTVARVWDLHTGTLIRTLAGHRGWVGDTCCFGLDDGTVVAVTTSSDGTARVWNLPDGSLRLTLAGHADSVTSTTHLTVPGEIDLLLTGSRDGSVRTWDLSLGLGGNEIILQGHTDLVTGLACGTGPESEPVIISGSRDGTLRGWRVEDGSTWQIPMETNLSSVSAVACGWDMATPVVAAADSQGLIHVRPLRGTANAPAPDRQSPAVTAIACQQNRAKPLRLLAASAWGREVVTWPGPDSDLGGPVHGGLVRAVAWATPPDGTDIVLTASNDGTAAAWELDTGHLRYTLAGHADQVTALATATDASAGVVVTGSQDCSVRCWHLADGALICCLQGHQKPITSVACTPASSGGAVASASEDFTVRLWDTRSQQCLQIITLPEVPTAVAFVADTAIAVAFGAEVGCFQTGPLSERQPRSFTILLR